MSLFPCSFEFSLINFLNYWICSLWDLFTLLPGEGVLDYSILLVYPPPPPVFFFTKLLARLWAPHPPFTNLLRSSWIWVSSLSSFSFYYLEFDLCLFFSFLAYYNDYFSILFTIIPLPWSFLEELGLSPSFFSGERA